MKRLRFLLILAGLPVLTYAQVRIDSTATKLPSELVVRTGFASQVAYAGRTLGVNQVGFSPSVAYYHRSGLFGSVAGSYYSAEKPRYALTTFSAGYSKDITDKLSATLTYDHLYFTPTPTGEGSPLSNGVDGYLNYDFGPVNLTADYSHYWGQQSASQFNAIASGFAIIRPHNWLDKIVLMPSVSALWGSDNVVFSQLRPAQTTVKKQKPKTETVSQSLWGLLDYELTLPVRFYKNNFRLLATYHYVIPHALNATEDGLKPLSYVTASVSYVLKSKR